MTSIEYNGSCVCGQTTYEAFDLGDVSYCHCEQCRKMTGHYMAACQVKRDKIKIKGKIKWFYTHEGSRHGFCDNCGGKLEQRPDDNSETIQERLKVYEQSTAPLKEFYKKQGNLKTVEAKGSVDEIFFHVCGMIK